MNNGALHFNALLTTRDFETGIRRLENQIRGISNTTQQETSKIDGYFKNLSTGIGAYFSANMLQGFVQQLIQVRGEFQKTEIAFGTMLQSKEKAKELMGQMVDLAAKTPFSLKDVSDGAKQLLAFQVPANEVVETLRRMGDVAAGLGVPMGQLIHVYGQVKAQGKLMTNDLYQFMNAGIPILSELGKVLGKSEAEIKKMVGEGKIGFTEIQQVIQNLTNEGGLFFNLMEKQSASLPGRIANLGDAWEQMLNKIGENNEGILYKGIEGLTSLVENYEEVMEILVALTATYGAYKTAVIATATTNQWAKQTIQSEIATLSISEKMKLGRALVTQRQAEASLREAQAEKVATMEKYKALQVEVEQLAIKKQKAIALATEKAALLDNAKAELIASNYSSLQADIKSIAVKREKAVVLATEKAQLAENARYQAVLAQKKLENLSTEATATKRHTVAKQAEIAQNKYLAAQEQADIARKKALALNTEFSAKQKELETGATMRNVTSKKIEALEEQKAIARKNALVASSQFYTAKKNLENTATAVGIASKKVENAQEAVSVATKNASAIATARLTIAQRIQTIATNLGARAQAFLNATILANPYALATAALVALSYGIYKFASQVDTATELQEELNKTIAEGAKTVDETRAKIETLINSIKDENKTNEEKWKIAKQLETLSEGKIKLLNLEAIKTGELDTQVKSYIDTLYKQAEAMSYVNQLSKLYEKDREKDQEIEDAIKNGRGFWNTLGDFVDKDAWKGYNKDAVEYLETLGYTTEQINSLSGGTINRLANEKKALQENIELVKEKSKEFEKYNKPKENATPTPLDSTKEDKKKKPAKPKDTAIAGSLGAYEEQLSKVQETLKNKTLATDKERVKALLEQEKELQEKIKEIKEQYAQRTFDEELAEIQRQVNLRDKYLQAGYSKESMDNLFPKVKDKTYLGYLEQTQKRLKDLLETGKGNQETAEQLDRVNKAIDEFTAKKSYIEGIQETIENLSTQFSGAELIDKLKKIKNLNANETEQESQEKANLINKAIEQEEQKMKQAYQRFLQEHKSFEERRLEITKRYALLKAQAETDAEAKKKIEKAEAKEKSELELDFFKESGDWGLAFSNLEYLGQSTIERLIQSLEEFKKAKAETLQPTELKELNAVIENLRAKANRNPLKGLVDGFKEFSASKKGVKKAQEEYNEAIEKYGKNSDEAQEKQKKLTEEEEKSAKTRQKIFDGLNKTQEIFNAIGDGVMNIADAFGGLDDASKDAVEDIMAIGNAALDLGKSIASGDVAGMIKAGIQLIGNIFKALSGDKKRERNIKRWAEALEGVKEKYRELEYQMKKTLGEGVYKEQAGMIANLRKQQEHLQKMANEEANKKKSDGGKIREWQNQIKEINRQIDDIMDNMINDIAKTDAKSLADQIGDALVDAFSRGEDAALAYEKTMDEVMKNAIKSALKQKLLAEPMKALVDDMVAKMGYSEGKGDENIKRELEKYENALKISQENQKYAHLKDHFKGMVDKLKQDFENSKKAGFSGTFDGLTASEREEIKEKGKDAMNRYMEALKQYEDLFGSADANADSLKGAIKGMSEETAGVLAGQFNAIRMNIGELIKNSAFSLEAMKNAVGHLIKIEENTFNLHQIRKDLAELNSKVKGDKDFRANGF